MNKYNKHNLVKLEGSPKERGITHGRALKSMIEESLERMRELIFHAIHMNPDLVIKLFMKKTKFLEAVKKWTPELLEEVEGIAEGAEINFDTLFMFQCQDEMIWFSRAINPSKIESCSIMGCFREDNTPALLAQNLDWLNVYDGLNAVLRIKHRDSSLESFIPTTPGFIGWCGLNNQSIAIAMNSLFSFLNNSIEGLPVSFIVRSVLEQRTLEDAISFIQKIKHASSQNYMISDAEKVVNFECSANKICQFIPYKGARRVYHTNHPFINNDLILPPLQLSPENTTWERYKYLEYRLKDPKKRITLETLKNILRSHYGPVCVHQDFTNINTCTIKSMLYSLTKSSPELYLAEGPPCSTEYKRFFFD